MAGAAAAAWDEYKPLFAPGYAEPEEHQFVHIPPTLTDLEESRLHPELQDVIRRGHDLLVDTPQLRGQHGFNDMNCARCHMDAGRQPFSAALWPAAIALPDYRGKNRQVNSLDERVVGCFTYSMNGQPPEYGSSDTMLAITAYLQWMARACRCTRMKRSTAAAMDRWTSRNRSLPLNVASERGKEVYAQNCAICRTEGGQGLKQDGQVVFPPLWGNGSLCLAVHGCRGSAPRRPSSSTRCLLDSQTRSATRRPGTWRST
ncbi:c-type cytochrome [Thioalkalivibrio sp.]|uniref:c-type cytochrome n=1 Tax=Thioalkalivibrio sp. TaxID=2093813 RepID=UPI0035647F2F